MSSDYHQVPATLRPGSRPMSSEEGYPLEKLPRHEEDVDHTGVIRRFRAKAIGHDKRTSTFIKADAEEYSEVYMSKSEHFWSWFLPFLGFFVILTGLWSVTFATEAQPSNMIEVKSFDFFQFAVEHPTIMVATGTFIASILNAILAWCFAQSIIIYARHRLVIGRPFSLRGLAAFQSAKDGAFALHPAGTKWMWLCALCWGIFLSSTTGFNVIIFPQRRVISQVINADDLDMTSAQFAAFYEGATAGTNPAYYDCSRWTSVRGLVLSPCPAGTGFSSIIAAGRSELESAGFGELSYLRLGNLSFAGWADGVLPYTSFKSGDSNAFDSAADLKRIPHPLQNTSIHFIQQGFKPNVTCFADTTSPIDPTTGALACNSETPTTTLNPPLRMKAGFCESRPSNGSYAMYMRFFGDYVGRAANGGVANENITCVVNPIVGQHQAVWHGFDNSTWVRPRVSTGGAYPPRLVERILANIVSLIIDFGQNANNNLYAEEVVLLSTAYGSGDPSFWPTIIQRQMDGMTTFLATWERVLAEQATLGDASLPRLNITGTLQHESLAYSATWPNYVLLVPITVACFLGLGFLLVGSLSGHRSMRFDPLDTVSHIVAASTGRLGLEESGRAGARPDDKRAADAEVSFMEHEDGAWGFVRR